MTKFLLGALFCFLCCCSTTLSFRIGKCTDSIVYIESFHVYGLPDEPNVLYIYDADNTLTVGERNHKDVNASVFRNEMVSQMRTNIINNRAVLISSGYNFEGGFSNTIDLLKVIGSMFDIEGLSSFCDFPCESLKQTIPNHEKYKVCARKVSGKRVYAISAMEVPGDKYFIRKYIAATIAYLDACNIREILLIDDDSDFRKMFEDRMCDTVPILLEKSSSDSVSIGTSDQNFPTLRDVSIRTYVKDIDIPKIRALCEEISFLISAVSDKYAKTDADYKRFCTDIYNMMKKRAGGKVSESILHALVFHLVREEMFIKRPSQ